MAESSELLATYAGLGTHDGSNYYRGDECLACVKDLIRALRSDDSRCEIRRQLGQAGILQQDLLPILVTSSDNTVLRNDVIRLLVNLTQPAYLCFGGQYPKNKDSDLMKCFLEVNRHLRGYKESFALEDVMNTLGTVLADLCQKEWEDRDDDDVIVIERILLLIRNILHISPEAEEEKRTDDDVSVHDQIIWNLHINGIDELLLFLGSNQTESQWCMHVLEIMFLMMREQSPETLAKTGKGRTAAELKREEELVDEALATERARRHKTQHLCGSRHPSFGGTFVVKNQKSISGSNRVYHRRLSGVNDYSYDAEKKPRRIPKQRRPAKDLPGERRSTYSIRNVLKNICVQFLECCYNPLMKVVKDNIMHQRAMGNDETYYLWCLRFFMEFSRLHSFRVDIVGETLQLSTLHYIIQLMANYFESMVVEKKTHLDARQWAQRLHYAVQAYKELLLYIQEMSLSETERENSKVMQSNVFYHPEYRDIFVTLLRNFYEVFQTTSCLRDVVECTHVYVRMMERYCSENKHLVVRETKRKSKKKGKSKQKGPPKMLSESQLVDLWEVIDARVAELCEGVEPLPAPPIPFDSASEVPLEDQKLDAMGRVKMFLIDAEHPEAVALVRAAREVWPDDVFGSSGISPDDETEVIRSILLSPQAVMPASRFLGNGDDGDESEEDEEGGGASEVTNVEMQFSIKSYIERFANNKIVRSYCLVLSDYQKNSDSVNHATVKMLYRIAFQLKMAPLLYQISVFRTLQNILNEPTTPRFKELQKFSRHVVAGFFAMTTKNPLMFVELLFWKTSQDCYELTQGYGTRDREKELKHLSVTWTMEQEKELEELFNRYKDEDDIVACIEAALDGEIPRTRRQIAKQLVTQGLVDSTKQLNKKPKKSAKGVWSEEELARLCEVFGCEGGGDVRGVMEFFPGRGIRDITAQLKMLGLIPEGKKKLLTPKLVPFSESSDSESEKPRRRTKPSIKSNRMEPRLPKRAPSRSGLSQVVSRLHSEGYSDQLQWLEAYLSDEARDRRMDDEWEDMSVVAVSGSIAKALTTEGFQQLLSLLKLQPPSQQEVYWRIPATMTPQQLEDAVKSLHDDEQGYDDHHDDGEDDHHGDGQGYVSSDRSEDERYPEEREMTKTEALSELLKSKGKSPGTVPLAKGKSRTRASSQGIPLSKRPHLSRRSSFFNDSDSEPEIETRTPHHNLRPQRKNRPRHELSSSESEDDSPRNRSLSDRELPSGDIEEEQAARHELSNGLVAVNEENHRRRARQLPSSDDEGGDSVSPSHVLTEEATTNGDSCRKRTRQVHESSEESASEEERSRSVSNKPAKKAPKLLDSDSESENELVMDLESREINSPVTETVELSTGYEGTDSDYTIQAGSMGTLTVSKSVA